MQALEFAPTLRQLAGRLQAKGTSVPLYMDVHRLLRAASPESLEQAHAKDMDVQSKHGVKYLKYWASPKDGFMFCLLEAPSKEAAFNVHREAHGLTADEIYEVQEGA